MIIYNVRYNGENQYYLLKIVLGRTPYVLSFLLVTLVKHDFIGVFLSICYIYGTLFGVPDTNNLFKIEF